MKQCLRLALISSVMVGTAFAQSIGNSSAITEARLKAHLEFIAHDLLEGRNTPSRGLDIACEYVASQLKLWGVKPAGENGTYFQTLEFYGSKVEQDACSGTLNTDALSYGRDYYSVSGTGKVGGSMVFVGYGWQIPEMKLDPYKGLDCKGKVLVVMSGSPKGFGFRERRGPLGKGAKNASQMALELGAEGVITIPAGFDIRRFEQGGAQSLVESRPQAQFTPRTEGKPVIVVSQSIGDRILTAAGKQPSALATLAENGEPLDSFVINGNSTIGFNIGRIETSTKARNVVAMVEGSDKALKNEFVAVGAHIDHIGTTNRGDGVFNGADDDGSGTVAILEMAHAFQSGKRPKRSVLFVWHCGEERGLLGSRLFTESPTVPLENIVCQLNIDMIGKSKQPGDTNTRNAKLLGPDGVYIVGTTMMSTELGQAAHRANAKMYKLTYDPKHDAPDDPDRIYYRSDHYSYAQKGIPVLFWFSGEHADYHGLEDEVDRIDFRKLARVAQTVYATAWEVGNMKSRPKVDKPLRQ